jgi:hypothetical protein
MKRSEGWLALRRFHSDSPATAEPPYHPDGGKVMYYRPELDAYMLNQSRKRKATGEMAGRPPKKNSVKKSRALKGGAR